MRRNQPRAVAGRVLMLGLLLVLLAACAAPNESAPPDEAEGVEGVEPPAPADPVAEEPPPEEQPPDEAAGEDTAEGPPPPVRPMTPPVVELPPPSPPDAPMEQIPLFPWPPPPASAAYVLTAQVRGALGDDAATLGDVDRVLQAALDANGYVTRSYFAVPDGFALVTQLEQIFDDGRPKPPPDRWATQVGPLRSFSLGAYIRALFRAREGRYRILVFVVTARPFAQTGEPVDRTEATAWLQTGLNLLPSSIAARPHTTDFATTALVYEFEQPAAADPRQVDPSPLDGRMHLAGAGLLQVLER